MKNFVFFLVGAFMLEQAAMALEIHGHRGARAKYPENTISGIEHALEVGVEVLEFDLGVTKDNVVILHHDRYVNPDLCQWGGEKPRRIKKDTWVKDLSLAEIKSIDCGTLPNDRFPKQIRVPGEKIPTLDEVFEYVKKSKHPIAKTVKFNIETKIHPRFPSSTVGPELFAKLVYESIKKHGLLERTVVQSFDFRTLEEIRKLDSNVKISALTADREDWLSIAKKLKAEVISPNWETIEKEDVQKLQEKGILVVPWTANTQDSWKKLIDYGVDGIITDDPENLVKYVAEQHPKIKRHSSW